MKCRVALDSMAATISASQTLRKMATSRIVCFSWVSDILF